MITLKPPKQRPIARQTLVKISVGVTLAIVAIICMSYGYIRSNSDTQVRKS